MDEQFGKGIGSWTMQRSDRNVLYLVFISPDQDFGELRSTFEQMLRTLRVR